MKAHDLDQMFDAGKNVSKYLKLSKIRKPIQEQKRVNVDFPIWIIRSLDRAAKRLGIPRQAIIKIWVAERLQKELPQIKPVS